MPKLIHVCKQYNLQSSIPDIKIWYFNVKQFSFIQADSLFFFSTIWIAYSKSNLVRRSFWPGFFQKTVQTYLRAPSRGKVIADFLDKFWIFTCHIYSKHLSLNFFNDNFLLEMRPAPLKRWFNTGQGNKKLL